MKLKLFKIVNENFRIKIFVASFLVILLISCSFTLFFLHRQGNSLTAALMKNGELLAGVLAFNSRIGVFSESGDLLADAANGILRQEGILRVSIFNAEGKLLWSKAKLEAETLGEATGNEVSRRKIMDTIRETVAPLSRSRDDSAEFWSPVTSTSESYAESSLFFKEGSPQQKKMQTIGFAMIVVDKRPLNKALTELLFKTIFIGIVFLIIGSCIAYIIVRGITKPLNQLIKSVKTLGTEKTMEKVAVASEDEIGDLAKAFNGMTERLGKRERALRDSEDKYRESERELRLLIESAPDAIFIHINGCFVYLNQKAVRLFGAATAEDLLGRPIIDRVHPDFRASMKERYHLRDEQKSALPVELQYIQIDGSLIDVESCSVPITYESKAASLTFVRDITDRKRAELERQSLQEKLKRSERMEAVGKLAGGVAHDLNNILSVSMGYAELLQYDIPEESPLRKPVDLILASSIKAAAIIEDLLTLARRNVMVSLVMNLNKVVQDFIKTPVFEKIEEFHPHVKFRMELDEELLNIKGSPVHLEKTLMNLVSNAAEAISGTGEVTIRTEARYVDKPIPGYDTVKEGEYAVLIIEDTGIGIPAEQIDKIFEPFYTKKAMRRSGTGLGLAIVWGTVKDHLGYIDVRSTVGQGTTFTLFFPVTRQAIAEDKTIIPFEQYMGRGESVLVVDDVGEQRQMATTMLTKLGYRVTSVASGEEAVAYLRNDKADILVLDMIMVPGIDGLETYKQARAINPTQKAIVVSGFSATDGVKEAQALGAGAYVKKPYVMEKIGMAIRRELDGK